MRRSRRSFVRLPVHDLSDVRLIGLFHRCFFLSDRVLLFLHQSEFFLHSQLGELPLDELRGEEFVAVLSEITLRIGLLHSELLDVFDHFHLRWTPLDDRVLDRCSWLDWFGFLVNHLTLLLVVRQPTLDDHWTRLRRMNGQTLDDQFTGRWRRRGNDLCESSTVRRERGRSFLLLITVVGTDFGRAGGFSRMITGEGVRGGGGR